MNRTNVVALAVAMVATAALAQDQELPLTNWTAPPFWKATPVARHAGPEGQIQAEAQGMTASIQSLPSSPLPFVAITPCRIVDTRVNVADGFHEPNFADDETRTFDLPNSPDCTGLPSTAGAWSLNVQFRPIAQASYITMFPTGTTRPLVSTTVGTPAGFTTDAAIVPAGTSGDIDVYCQYAGRVVIDINGYYASQSLVSSLNTKTGDLTLAAGSNVTITPSTNTLTIAATGGPGGELPVGSVNQTLRNNGSSWVASSALVNDGTNVGISGNLLLPDSTGSTGVIDLGGVRFVLDYAGPGSDGQNTFIGQQAGNFTMGCSPNCGSHANYGSHNAAIGYLSLNANTTGSDNTASGADSLNSNTTGSENTASGFQSLLNNTTGYSNTASGADSLASNTTGDGNTATGVASLFFNTTGSYNTAIGFVSLFDNISGHDNVAVGVASLNANTTGIYDTAVGSDAGNRDETITGYAGTDVTLVPNQTGNYNTFIGRGTGATTQVGNCTAVGVDAYCTATNQVRLGNYHVSSIGGEVAWSALSDARAKTDIRDLDLGLDLIMKLRPVTYRLRSGNGKTDLGLVAQDVETVLGNSYNVVDVGGDPDRTLSLRYTELIAPLVRAIQEQQAQIEAKDARIAALEKTQSFRQAEMEGLKTRIARADTLQAQMQELRQQVAILMAKRDGAAAAQMAGN
jgi:hypothetical protein